VRLRDLLSGADVLDRRGDLDVKVTSLVHDSREVVPGALFCCVPGDATDGHDHAAEAVASGAVALVVERALDLPVPQAVVASVRAEIGPLSAELHGHPSRRLRLIGVTGTNGKTTTTYLVEAIARAAGEAAGVIGTVATRIAGEEMPQPRTTPEAPELQALLGRMVERGVVTVAMEVSSHALAMQRVRGTWFEAACFTNLGHDHLDFHGTMERYFDAKALLFSRELTNVAAINVDDPAGADIESRARKSGVDVWTFGRAARERDVSAEDVRQSRDGTTLRLVSRRGAERDAERDAVVTSSLVGDFNVQNVLAAATSALAAGLPWDAVVLGLSSPIVVPGRMERVANDLGLTVLVDYAHTPDALERALDAARPLVAPAGRLIAVFGAGGDRDREKRPHMGAAVAARADLALLTTDNPRSEDPAAIVDDVRAGIGDASPARVVVELDRRAAIREALAAAAPGDVVLIAGKGHESGQTAAGVTVPFDDRVVATEELEELSCT
jgi:UDP-N-acetylmuramoyl-L-alanyl-D-glutamate--2,6-diaminopimelate ligase